MGSRTIGYGPSTKSISATSEGFVFRARPLAGTADPRRFASFGFAQDRPRDDKRERGKAAARRKSCPDEKTRFSHLLHFQGIPTWEGGPPITPPAAAVRARGLARKTNPSDVAEILFVLGP